MLKTLEDDRLYVIIFQIWLIDWELLFERFQILTIIIFGCLATTNYLFLITFFVYSYLYFIYYLFIYLFIYLFTYLFTYSFIITQRAKMLVRLSEAQKRERVIIKLVVCGWFVGTKGYGDRGTASRSPTKKKEATRNCFISACKFVFCYSRWCDFASLCFVIHADVTFFQLQLLTWFDSSETLSLKPKNSKRSQVPSRHLWFRWFFVSSRSHREGCCCKWWLECLSSTIVIAIITSKYNYNEYWLQLPS